MREIYENAVDSLSVGMRFFLEEDSYSSRKHAILTIFHSIELLLKEYLFRINPILIYKNIDKRITEESFTAGIGELLIRLENLNVDIPQDQIAAIRDIQKKRNQIEHHRYDKKEEDEQTIAKSLRFVLFFVEHTLEERLEEAISADTLREIQRLVLEYGESEGLAEYRLTTWLQQQWPDWNQEEENIPEEFEGTLDCPECGMSYLVMERHNRPFCYFCNTEVDATECENCGVVYSSAESHECW